MSLRRRDLLGAILLSGWTIPFASAQQQKKIARIGFLSGATAEVGMGRVKELLEGLRELGYVEGKNLVIESRFAGGKRELISVLADELVRLNPDCIYAGGVGPTVALMRATKTIPIVFGNIDADPVKEGIVKSLSRPGGNVTGLTGIQWELAGKRLELLKEIVPKAQRIGLLFDPRSPAGDAHRDATLAAARTLGVQLQLLEVRNPNGSEIDQVVKAAREGGVEAVSVIHVGLIGSHMPRVTRLMMEARLPAIYSDIRFIPEGGLIVYAPDTSHQRRRAAVFVDKILKGTKPADLPVEQPTKFELVLNMKTAKALGITFPQSILVQASQVIQ